MKIQLIFKQTDSSFGYEITTLTHVKLLDEKGNYVKFAKHSPELIAKIRDTIIEIPDD